MSWWALCSSTRANTRNTAAPRRKAASVRLSGGKTAPVPGAGQRRSAGEAVMQAMAAPGIVPYPSIFIPPFSTGPGVLSRPAFRAHPTPFPGRKSRVSAKKFPSPGGNLCFCRFYPCFSQNRCPGALCIEMRAERKTADACHAPAVLYPEPRPLYAPRSFLFSVSPSLLLPPPSAALPAPGNGSPSRRTPCRRSAPGPSDRRAGVLGQHARRRLPPVLRQQGQPPLGNSTSSSRSAPGAKPPVASGRQSP